MKEFVLLFRMNIATKEAQPTKEQMKIYMQEWMEWINNIADEGYLAEGGNHFSRTGRVLRSDNSITESPHISYNNSVAGYIIVLAKNISDASRLAERCPILKGENTSVEIREVASAGE